jgi:hypothetical protein
MEMLIMTTMAKIMPNATNVGALSVIVEDAGKCNCRFGRGGSDSEMVSSQRTFGQVLWYMYDVCNDVFMGYARRIEMSSILDYDQVVAQPRM